MKSLITYLVALKGSIWSGSALRRSCEGESVDVIRSTAAMCASLDARMLSMGARTGVVALPATPREGAALPIRRAADTRRRRAVFRGLVRLPWLSGGVIRFLVAVLRTPVALYCLAGSCWITWGQSILTRISKLPHTATSLASAAASALVVAILAIVFDHGISPRMRSRNAFRHERLVTGETAIRRLHLAAGQLVTEIDQTVASLTAAAPEDIASAALQATRHGYTVTSGLLANGKGERRGASWILAPFTGHPASRPLRKASPQSHQRREGSDTVQQPPAWAGTIREIMGDAELRGKMVEAAPRRARRFLRRCELMLRRDGAPTSDATQALANRKQTAASDIERQLAWQIRVLEIGGFSYIWNATSSERTDEEVVEGATAWTLEVALCTVDQQKMQLAVDDYFHALHNDVWDLLLLRAEAIEFIQSVSRHQFPAGFIGNITRRFGF